MTGAKKKGEDESQLFADDLRVGMTFSGKPHVMGDAEFSLFARMTGDDHPIHYDDAYAAKTRFGKRLTHGLLLMSLTALGATPMSRRLHDAMVAFAEQRCRFVEPVFIGDTVTSRFEVASVERQVGCLTAMVRFHVRLLNQARRPVLEGQHAYILRCRPISAVQAG